MITPFCYLHANSEIFEDNIDYLLAQMVDKERIIQLSFFGISTEDRYEEDLFTIKSAVSFAFGARMPLITYIVQSLENPDEMAVEVHYLPVDISSESVVYKERRNVRYAVLEWNSHKSLIIEGVRSDSSHDSLSAQSDHIFQKIEEILSEEEMHIHEIVRQWNYIGQITEINNGIQNYQAFNNARARFYAKTTWEEFGYPAATGIGMSIHGIIVGLIAVSNRSDIRIYPIDNPLQVTAHHYSSSMLVGAQKVNSKNETPKFERAKVVQGDSGMICYISGTAAIRGEQSMREMDVALQTRQTIENIIYLISAENIKRHGVSSEGFLFMSGLRVYIKRNAYFSLVKAEVEKVWSKIPIIYVQADICRSELLVEIEGVAVGV
ncbi:MAG: hypothetical protein PHS30_04915 [Bacteroidales bacterium]|nr:hypothetical protein [Bacteroidales bacterium]